MTCSGAKTTSTSTEAPTAANECRRSCSRRSRISAPVRSAPHTFCGPTKCPLPVALGKTRGCVPAEEGKPTTLKRWRPTGSPFYPSWNRASANRPRNRLALVRASSDVQGAVLADGVPAKPAVKTILMNENLFGSRRRLEAEAFNIVIPNEPVPLARPGRINDAFGGLAFMDLPSSFPASNYQRSNKRQAEET